MKQNKRPPDLTRQRGKFPTRLAVRPCLPGPFGRNGPFERAITTRRAHLNAHNTMVFHCVAVYCSF